MTSLDASQLSTLTIHVCLKLHDRGRLVLTFEFSATDLARTRFAVSPLLEVVTSTHARRRAGSDFVVHLPWIRHVRAEIARTGAMFPLLEGLVPAAPGYIPDFLARPPAGTGDSLEEELAALIEADPERVRVELSLVAARSPDLESAFSDPTAGLVALAAEIRRYWDLALADHWPRIARLLEGEVLFRARQLADGGVNAVLSDLGAGMDFSSGELRLARMTCMKAVRLSGKGLLLVPSVFTRPSGLVVTDEPWQPTLIYPPRGTATLWEWGGAAEPAALASVLGRARARILAELSAPASTTELARWTGFTPGGVSTHLHSLRSAGLVAAHRRGRTVLYARTGIAESLVRGVREDVAV